MKRSTLLLLALAFFCLTSALQAQQIDAAFGVSTVSSPGPGSDLSYSLEKIGAGAYPSFSGDILFKHQLGFQGEVAWRAKQAVYGGYQPYRPILYDFNGIWAPRLGKRAGAEIMGGIGAESIRFYTPYVNCSFTGCTDYVSSNHMLGHVGGGLKFYMTKSIFIRPEAHVYFVRNNFEFTGPRMYREGFSVGYTFRPED